MRVDWASGVAPYEYYRWRKQLIFKNEKTFFCHNIWLLQWIKSLALEPYFHLEHTWAYSTSQITPFWLLILSSRKGGITAQNMTFKRKLVLVWRIPQSRHWPNWPHWSGRDLQKIFNFQVKIQGESLAAKPSTGASCWYDDLHHWHTNAGSEAQVPHADLDSSSFTDLVFSSSITTSVHNIRTFEEQIYCY